MMSTKIYKNRIFIRSDLKCYVAVKRFVFVDRSYATLSAYFLNSKLRRI